MHRRPTPTTVTSRTALLAGSVTAVATAAWLCSLHLAPALPISQLGDWGEWWRTGDPLDLAAAVLRPVALVALGYVVLAVLAALVAARAGRGHGMVGRLFPSSVRRPLAALAAAAVGASSVAGPAGAASDAGSTTPAQDPPTMEVLGRPRTSLPWAAGPVAIGAPVEASTATAPEVVPTGTTPSAEGPPGTVVVQPGEHLWTVAESQLGRRLGRPPTDDETDPYWRALVAANRDRLVDPDNPDLIFSGQQLVLPPAG